MGDVKTTLTWLLRDQVSSTAKAIDGNLGKLGVKTKNTGANMGILAGTMLAAGAVALGLAEKFADEEVGVARLGASLRANVKDWDGNTDAIEKTITAREALAFSDDDLRNSLALLVGATHNVSKAWELQSTAMDLARFKGIDLATASEALIKIEGGSYRALKALIGSTKDITTTEEALAAVRKVAAGQADAYAETTKGKIDRLKIAFEDLQENAGEALVNIGDGWAVLIDRLKALTGGQTPVNRLTVDMNDLRTAADKLGPGFSVAGQAASRGMAPVVTKAERLDARLRAILESQWGNAVKTQAKNAMGGGVLDSIAGVLTTIDTMIASIEGGAQGGHTPGKKKKGGKGGGGVGQAGTGKAGGGPVSAGETYTVGEHGPETLVMGSGSGNIIPNGGMGVTIQGVSAAQIADMVDRELYFKLSRSSPSAVRK